MKSINGCKKPEHYSYLQTAPVLLSDLGVYDYKVSHESRYVSSISFIF